MDKFYKVVDSFKTSGIKQSPAKVRKVRVLFNYVIHNTYDYCRKKKSLMMKEIVHEEDEPVQKKLELSVASSH